MAHIVLTAEQTRILNEADDFVELRDEQGRILARILSPALEADVAEARRRLASNQPRWSSAQVKSLLARLTEIRAREGMDEARLRELVNQFRAGQMP